MKPAEDSMETNHQLLANITLEKGPHRTIDDGKMNVIEAATLYAGYRHHPVDRRRSWFHRFSWPVASFALELHDNMADDIRHHMFIDFVPRIAACSRFSPDWCRSGEDVRRYYLDDAVSRLMTRYTLKVPAGGFASSAFPWKTREFEGLCAYCDSASWAHEERRMFWDECLTILGAVIDMEHRVPRHALDA
jgi:hypothetical protein